MCCWVGINILLFRWLYFFLEVNWFFQCEFVMFVVIRVFCSLQMLSVLLKLVLLLVIIGVSQFFIEVLFLILVIWLVCCSVLLIWWIICGIELVGYRFWLGQVCLDRLVLLVICQFDRQMVFRLVCICWMVMLLVSVFSVLIYLRLCSCFYSIFVLWWVSVCFLIMLFWRVMMFLVEQVWVMFFQCGFVFYFCWICFVFFGVLMIDIDNFLMVFYC